MKRKYQLIALDMDGTVLNEHKKIDLKTQQAIRKALACGKEVVFCTGRAYAEMDEFLPLFPDMHYLCLESGALLYDLRAERPLHTTSVSLDAVRTIRNSIAGKDVLVQIISEGRSLVNSAQVHHLEHYHMGVYQELYDRTVTPTEDIFALVEKETCSVEKVNIFHTTLAECEQTRKIIASFNLPITMIIMVDSEVISLECTACGVSKATGLQVLCDTLNLGMEQVIMVGDSANDLDALKASGLAIAMGNARPEVTEICDVQVADNNHNGCAQAIERYLLD